MYCRKCGSKLVDSALFCANCGEPVSPPQPQQPVYQQPSYPQPAPSSPTDTGHWGWFVLGLFVPIAGLVLYLVWKKERPLAAKRAGLGALVGAIISFVSSILKIALAIFLGIAEGLDPSFYNYEFYSRILPFLFK